MNFGFKPPKPMKMKTAPMVNEKIPTVSAPSQATDTLHALNEEISRRRNNMYSNPGETVTKETGQPSYFTGIKRLLRSKYGGGGQ